MRLECEKKGVNFIYKFGLKNQIEMSQAKVLLNMYMGYK